MVVIGILITGLLVTMSLSSGNQVQMASLTLYRDRAFYAAEAGLQHAYWELEYNNWASRSYPALSGSVPTGTYTVTATAQGWNSPHLLTATGTSDGNPTAQSVIHAELGPIWKVPAIALGGDFSGGGGVHVTGEIQLRGAITQHGNFSVYGGNVHASGAIRSGVSYDTGFQGYPNRTDVPAPPNVTTIANTLKATPGAQEATSTDSLVFPPSGILYYNGTFSQTNKNASISGEGTLVVFGDVSIKKGDFLVGHHINIVCTGNFTTLGGSSFNLAGSLDCAGSITSQSQFAVQGVICCQGGLDTQGQGADVSILPVPSWDPRLTAAGQGTQQVSGFTGPIF